MIDIKWNGIEAAKKTVRERKMLILIYDVCYTSLTVLCYLLRAIKFDVKCWEKLKLTFMLWKTVNHDIVFHLCYMFSLWFFNFFFHIFWIMRNFFGFWLVGSGAIDETIKHWNSKNTKTTFSFRKYFWRQWNTQHSAKNSKHVISRIQRTLKHRKIY